MPLGRARPPYVVGSREAVDCKPQRDLVKFALAINTRVAASTRAVANQCQPKNKMRAIEKQSICQSPERSPGALHATRPA